MYEICVVSSASFDGRDFDPKVSYWTELKEQYMKENPDVITLDNYKEKKMIETVVALLTFWDGEIKEHRIQENMADCLRARRVAEREFNPNISYKCIR